MSDKLDVTIGISADASGVEAGVQRSKRSLADLGKSAKGVSDGLSGMGDGGAAAAKKIERDTRNMQQSLQRYLAVLEAGSKDSRVYWERMADFKGIDKNALRPLMAQLDEFKQKQQEAAGAAGGFGRALTGLAGAAGAAFALKEVAQQAYETQAALFKASAAAERLKIGLDFASARGGAAEIAYLRKTTYDLGLQFQGTALAYQQFQAAARGTALEGDKARAVFESVAKASAVMGLSADNTSGVLLALQQMISKGNVQAEELRGQLGERLPGAFQIAARSMGVTTAELGKMLENGEVLADSFLPKFAAELEKSLGDAPEKAANRLDASVNRVNDSWERMKQNLGDSGVSAFWAGQLNILTDAMGNVNNKIEEARAAGDGFGAQIGAAIKAYAQFLNPINAISYTALETSNRLKDAEQRLQELKAAGAQSSPNLMLRESYNHAQRLVDKLREAKAAQDALAGISSSNASQPMRDRETGNSRGNRTNYDKGLFESAQFLAQRNDGINKAFIADIEGLAKAYANGALSAKEYAAAVNDANKKRYESTEAGKAEAKAAKDGAKGNKEGESAILSYIKSLEARTAAQRLEIAQGDKLTESQRARIQLEALLADSKNKASKSQVANAQALLAESEANEAWLKNASDVEKALADMQKAREQSLQSVQDSVKKLVEEAEAAAYAETHNISLAEAVERLALARAENAYQQAVERQEAPATLAALEAELQARKKIVELTAQKGVKEANKKAAEQAAKDWEKVSQTIGDTLADYIMGGGKNAAQYLKRLFATLVLQPAVQTVVGGLMGTGVAGASGVASGGVGGVGGLVNSASNLYSMFNSPLLSTNIAAGLSSQIGTLGADLWMNGFESVGNSLIEFSSSIAGAASTINMIGNGLGYVSAIYSLSQGKYGSAIGAGIGTYVGGPIGAVIGSTLGGLVDGLFGGGTVHTGAAGVYTGGKVQASNASTARQPWIDVAYSPGMQASIDSVAGLIGGSLDAIATQLGKKSGYSVKIGYGADNDDPSFGAYNIVNPDGKKLAQYGWATKDFRFDSDPSKGYDQYLKSISQKTLSIMASEFGGWAGDIASSVSGTLDKLSGSDAVSALQTTAQQILTIVSGFKALGDQMSMFAGISTGVQTKLIKVSGSFDALASNAQSFYANYYSEQEQMDAAVDSLKEVFAKYGAALPATTEQYRALVEQQMAAGEAGAEFAAVLLGLNGTFKQVADAWKTELDSMEGSVGEFFDGLKSSISDLAADVAADRKGILRGTGVLTADKLRAAIAQTSVVAVSTSSIDAASRETATAASYADVRDAQLRIAQAAADARQQAIWAKLQAAPRTDRPGLTNDALWEEIITQQWNAHWARFRKGWNTRTTSDAERAANMDAMVSMYDQRMRERLQTQANAQAAADASGIADAQKAADEARLALQAAQQEEAQARVDYAAKINQFVADANGSITKLSELRGEVVSFYEAQAQAVQTMLQSAGNLRSVVEQLRLGQLDSAQTAAELSSRYAANYSMALATSGSTRAGYVDAMAGSLPALTDALKAQAVTGEDWRIQTAKLFAQATTAAGLLDGDAKASDYQEVALGLLDSIDGALSELGSAAQSAQDLIVSAIEQGTASNLVGLRAVIAALKGDPIPAFAAGGFHVGGLRLVGERGPELEATGPARIWTASQTAAMLGGGGSNAAVLAEIKALRDDNRRLGAENLRMQQRFTKLIERWEVEGMPSTRQEVVA